MTTSPEPPNPIFKLLDRVLDSREPECMWISARRGYEDVTKAIRRHKALGHSRYEFGHWYKDPHDQYARLVDLHTEASKTIIWKVDQRLLKTTPMFSLGKISLSAFIAVSIHFPCVCVVETVGAWTAKDEHEIMLFDEVDAIAAVAFLADHGKP